MCTHNDAFVTRRIGAREARQKFSRMLEWVAAGDEVVLLRRGKEIGVLCKRPLADDKSWLDELDKFRKTLRVKGKPLSQTIIEERRNARY